ncbi:MAG: SUMF1/EgtB/PvdO family nonheme iron enzyme [Burkholderiaceae bacterium]|nr:SUMF1/EgtB/PvdO family nonheme iron enzyme [Burkholderiaceae bacterium]
MRRLNKAQLREALLDARQYTQAWLADLDDARWQVPYLPIINPPLWELGHVGWFQERWCLRWRDGAVREPARLRDADRWYDSSAVAHATRWTLDLPDRGATERYLQRVLEDTLEALHRAEDSDDGLYFFRLALYHEDMHGEAFAYTRHTLAYPPPPALAMTVRRFDRGGDVALAGAEFMLGAPRGAGFVFDNEKWAHPVRLQPFAIARRPVTNAEYLSFVEAGGYERPQHWDEAGRAWLAHTRRRHPRDWRFFDGQWQQRVFDRWVPLVSDEPVMHVTAFEAEAWCRWAGRRLPSEAEWEFAATSGAIEWGEAVWEWTASPFVPYPGFAPDAYRDYSVPWFGTHRVVRGGSFVTRPRMRHPRYRNFYTPERDDPFIGFRSCALEVPG